jgi:hypothetical protein
LQVIPAQTKPASETPSSLKRVEREQIPDQGLPK